MFERLVFNGQIVDMLLTKSTELLEGKTASRLLESAKHEINQQYKICELSSNRPICSGPPVNMKEANEWCRATCVQWWGNAQRQIECPELDECVRQTKSN